MVLPLEGEIEKLKETLRFCETKLQHYEPEFKVHVAVVYLLLLNRQYNSPLIRQYYPFIHQPLQSAIFLLNLCLAANLVYLPFQFYPPCTCTVVFFDKE